MNKDMRSYEPLKFHINGIGYFYLDTLCWSCNYYREYNNNCRPIMEENGECSICHGKKFILTKTGEAIMELVKRHEIQHATKDDKKL